MTERLPVDVYTIIIGHLNLEDSISLLTTSSSLYFTRSLWLIPLENARRIRPLPCPPDQDFSVLEFPALRDIACKANRLEHNWSQEELKHTAIMKLQTDSQQFPIAVVPGFPVLVTWTRQRILQCWNMQTRMCLGTIERVHTYSEMGDRPIWVSKPYIEQGRMTLAVLSCEKFNATSAEIIILSVDYTAKGIIKFAERFRKTLFLEQLAEVTDNEAMPYRDRWPPRHQAQLTMYSPSAGFLVLYATCFAFNEEQDRMNPHPLKPDLADHLISLQALHVHDGSLHLYYYTRDGTEPVVIPTSDIIGNSADLSSDGAYRSCMYRIPLSSQWFIQDGTRVAHLFFWTAPHIEHYFKFPTPSNITTLQYHGESRAQYLLGLDGVQYGVQYHILYRFQTANDSPNCTAHRVSFPVRLYGIEARLAQHGLLIDDHLGIIYTCDEKGMIYALCYA